MTETTLTMVAEAVLGGQRHVTPAAPLPAEGAYFVADLVKAADGAASLQLHVRPAREAGVARLEKTCFEPVTFTVFRNGEPFHQNVVKNMHGAVTIDLASAFR